MKQEIRIFLREVGEICWLLIKNFILLVIRGIRYVYDHRVQIVQHKVTLPILIVMSVIWTGFSSFKSVGGERDFISVQPASASDYLLYSTQNTDGQMTSKKESSGNDSNEEEPYRNTKLVTHIMDWVGTPHRDNMQSKNGTDCSGFVQAVFQDAHGIALSRSSKAMYEKDVERINKAELEEGDLVFFNTFGSGISHVGIYLKDGKFAHTSTSKGVTVSSLQEKYYQKNYRGAGRIKELIN